MSRSLAGGAWHGERGQLETQLELETERQNFGTRESLKVYSFYLRTEYEHSFGQTFLFVPLGPRSNKLKVQLGLIRSLNNMIASSVLLGFVSSLKFDQPL